MKKQYTEEQYIEKQNKKRKGITLFVHIMAREFGTLIYANLLFILFSLPIITIGPSYTALNHIVVKVINDVPIDVFYEFKKAFKENFKQSFLASIIIAVFLFVFASSYIFYSSISLIFSLIFAIIMIPFLMAICFTFPIIATVELSLFNILKNSVILIFTAKLRIFSAFLIAVGSIYINIYFFPLNIFAFIFIAVSINTFINCFLLYPVIKQYIINDI